MAVQITFIFVHTAGCRRLNPVFNVTKNDIFFVTLKTGFYAPLRMATVTKTAEACPCTEYSGSGTKTVRFYTNTG